MSSNLRALTPFRFFLLLVCFFLSGVAGLIYQVAWTKALGLVFGHTVYAIATVLAAFMGGLAAGSAYLGRWGGRQARPVALYGWIELLIAATGALSLFGLAGVRSLYLSAYHLVAGSTPLLVALRFLASVLVLFLPTFLMGGTLPILTRGITLSSGELGSRFGRLYWVNTAGAVAGTLTAGFLLLPHIGLRLTVVSAVAFNLIAGGLALAVGGPSAEPRPAEPADKAAPSILKASRFLLVSFAIVGATAMAYEIAWTRLLATTLSSSTYAFTIMLATFLVGIVIGSWLFERWVSRGHEVSLATFTTTQTLTGLAAIVFLVLFQQLPAILWALLDATHDTFGGLVFAQFAISALAMLPTAVVFGFNFPVVTTLIAARSEDARLQSAAVGQACAANTFGAIAGAIAAGFWLVPRLGSFRLVAMTTAANLALAAVLLARDHPRQVLKLAGNAVLATIVVVTGWLGVLYDPAIANYNVVTNVHHSPDLRLNLDEAVRLTDLLFAEDGLNASVAVVRADNHLALRTNGKTDASNGDAETQLLVGHLGALFHPAPKKVLIIGFASGMTVSAVARYPEVQQIDCVEIEPAMLHAAPYLGSLNRGVLNDPRLHVIIDDARNFLFTTRTQYDLIISEPSNPWIAGVATLFTDEFYDEIRSRLAPGGVLVQWVQIYTMFPDDMKMMLGTVAAHFPQVTVWRGRVGDIALLAQTKPGPLTLDRLRQLWSVPGLREDYGTLGLHSPEGLVAHHVLDDPDLRKLIVNAPRNTDDLTLLEYRAPFAIFARNSRMENMRMLMQERSEVLPASLVVADRRTTLAAAAETSMGLHDYPLAGTFLTVLGKYPPTAETEMLRGLWFLGLSNPDEAKQAFESARRLDPNSLPALQSLAIVARLQNDYSAAEKLLREILARQPQSVFALESFALLERARGNFAQALEWEKKRLFADPSHPPEALGLFAELLLRTGDLRDAERVYFDLLHVNGYDSDAHRNLGEIYRQEKRWEEARVHLEIVVRYLPTGDPGLYVSLADVYRNLGRPREALDVLRKGKRLFPGDSSIIRAAATD